MKKWRMLLLALLLALLCGCAASEPLPDYAPEESQRLILYTSHKKEVWQPIVKEFEARTGVWVTVVEGGSNELLEQLAAKTDAPQADVMFGGGVESLESYQDLFAPYTCADADAILPQRPARRTISGRCFAAAARLCLQSQACRRGGDHRLGRSAPAGACGKDRLCRPVGLRLELYGACHDALRASG